MMRQKLLIYDYLRLARIDHWIKTCFMLPGAFVAFMLAKPESFGFPQLLMLFTGVLATCLAASANYVINEWLDGEFDRYHPVKKNRPMVTKNLKVKYILLEYAIFAITGLILSLLINPYFFVTQLWLLVMGIVYNVKPFRTKDIAFVDVLTESVNNIIRFLLGWFIITDTCLPPVSILFGYWMAGAFLMATKRFAEYRMINDPELAGRYRKSFQNYTERTLVCSSFFYAICATFMIGVFLIKYRMEYIFCMPILFLMFAYYLMMAFDQDSAVQKPEGLFREKKLMAIVSVFVLLVTFFSFVDVPLPPSLHDPYLFTIR